MARIIIIDDAADLRCSLQEQLEEHGHQVESLEQAEKALEYLTHTAFDLILLDNMMPGMTGIDFLKALKNHGLRIPVILMTGHTTTDITIQAINLDAFDYVVKPANYSELFRELQAPIEEALKISRPALAVSVRVDRTAPGSSGPVLLAESRIMTEVCKLIARYAKSDTAVLILGESG